MTLFGEIQESSAARKEAALKVVWGDSAPYHLSIQFEEEAVPDLGIRRARSFAADLHHKLETIHKAFRTHTVAAFELGVSTRTFLRWLSGSACPGSVELFRRIDGRYEFALERIAQRIRQGGKTTTKQTESERKKLCTH